MEQIQQYGSKNKTIKKRLTKKIDDWLTSIDDDDLVTMLRSNIIVAGGSIASMAMGDRVNDYDIYMRTQEAAIAVAQYYVDKREYLTSADIQVEVRGIENIKGEKEERVGIFIPSAGVASEDSGLEDNEEDNVFDKNEDIEEESDYRPVYLSENAITLSGGIQIVIRFYGEPDKIHSNYDFVHAMCYYDYTNNDLNMPVEALRSMMCKTLYYRGSLYPVCSLFRLRKFIKRGWKVSAGEILKIAMQISAIDLTDINVLRDQLTGVDQLYFKYLIDAMEEKGLKGDEFSLYLTEVIERVFGDADC